MINLKSVQVEIQIIVDNELSIKNHLFKLTSLALNRAS